MNPVLPLIHIVDAAAAAREALALLLGSVGLRVASWADPRAFVERFERDAMGAVVLDLRMPGLSGLTVSDLLRAQGVDQPLIVLTGHGTVAMCRRAFKADAAEFLEKPVDDEALLEAVHNAVRAHVRTRQREARERFATHRGDAPRPSPGQAAGGPAGAADPAVRDAGGRRRPCVDPRRCGARRLDGGTPGWRRSIAARPVVGRSPQPEETCTRP